MSDQKDGGPAFPEAFYKTSMSEAPTYRSGMSLRDWFAGQALAGLVSDSDSLAMMQRVATRDSQSLDKQVAVNAYAVADAMLAERERKP